MPSDDIARLYTFTAGNTIVAAQANGELDQLVTTMNNKVGRATTETITGTKTFSANNNHTGNNTFSGQNIFSDATAPLSTDLLSERTANNGILVDGCLIQDGNVRLGTTRATVTVSTGVNTTTEVITTNAAHGLTTADPVRVRATAGSTLPTGLSATTQYYARVLTTTTITLHPTAADATGNTNIVNITAVGSGTMWIIGDEATPADGDLWYNDGFKGRHLGVTSYLLTGSYATQAEQETGSSTSVAVSPGRQQFHPSAAKAWVRFNGTGTVAIAGSYNVTSITDNGTGDYTINFTTAFSGANTYAGVVSCGMGVAGTAVRLATGPNTVASTTSAWRVVTTNISGTLTDTEAVNAAFFGDQ